MSIDFYKLLSPESKARMAREHLDITRIFAMSDRFLAEELLKLARLTRDDNPGLMPYEEIYDNRYFWHVVPEIARRLGATHFRSNERTDAEIVQLSDHELRLRAGNCIRHISERRFNTLLLNEPIHGNPVVFAVDRLCPPQSIIDDPIAASIASIAAHRGAEFHGVWTMDFLGERRYAPADKPVPANVVTLRPA